MKRTKTYFSNSVVIKLQQLKPSLFLFQFQYLFNKHFQKISNSFFALSNKTKLKTYSTQTISLDYENLSNNNLSKIALEK